MKEYTDESWDGFDGKSYVYDEKKDKRYSSGIWKITALLSALMLIYIFSNHIKELNLIKQGTCIEAAYDEDKMTAWYADENGKRYNFILRSYYPANRNGYVRMYYINDIRYAQPETSPMVRLSHYMIFAVIFAVSARRIWKIYKKSSLHLNV